MEAWILYKLQRQPFTDANGRVLPNVTKRIVYTNDRRRAVLGGEWMVPDLTGITVLERYQRHDQLLICVDMPENKIQALLNDNVESKHPQTFRQKKDKKRSIVLNSETLVNPQAFRPQELSIEEADTMKEDVFGVTQPPPEGAGSRVT